MAHSSFVERESYKHLFAKNLLKKWFVEQDVQKDFCNVAQFKWRSNYGAFTELKFFETSTPYYFEASKGLIEHKGYDKNKIDLRGSNQLNWFDPNFDRGKILFVPDVTIFHKGTPTILLEVVHTSPLAQFKIKKIQNFFKGHHIELYEIQAEEILRHDKSIVPTNIVCKKIL